MRRPAHIQIASTEIAAAALAERVIAEAMPAAQAALRVDGPAGYWAVMNAAFRASLPEAASVMRPSGPELAAANVARLEPQTESPFQYALQRGLDGHGRWAPKGR